MTAARVAGEDFELDADAVEQAVADLDPEPIREHYVVIGPRRYPPKQVLAAITGLDRGDFTTHQARSILRRLGFGVHRKGRAIPLPRDPETTNRPPHGTEAALLEPFMGRFIAQDGLEVLYDSDSPYDVVRWLRKHGLRATVWRVPERDEEILSSTSMFPL